MNVYKRRQFIERLTIIAPMTEAMKWHSWCYDNGYRVVRSGPKPIAFRRVDPNKFKIIAERENFS